MLNNSNDLGFSKYFQGLMISDKFYFVSKSETTNVRKLLTNVFKLSVED
jgi:hypothetical protein